jgi:hypothetical protein
MAISWLWFDKIAVSQINKAIASDIARDGETADPDQPEATTSCARHPISKTTGTQV